MADTCPHCGPIGTFAGTAHLLNCPEHGLAAISKRAVEEHGLNGLTAAVFGVCAQHPFAPVINGRCRTCTDDLVDAATIKLSTKTVEGPLSPEGAHTFQKLAEAINALPPLHRAPHHPDTKRRDRYAAAIRDNIKAHTGPTPLTGGPSVFGATEHDIADAALAVADTESAQLLAERNAALRLCDVWDDAPDPACRAMAADLRSAIRGARPARLLDCGWCYEENGEEVHPHPECPIGRPATEATGARQFPAADALAATIRDAWDEVLADQDPTATCGAASEGIFDEHPLGPCIKAPHPEAQYHRDARGREWQLLATDPHRTELVRRLALAIHRYDYEHGLTSNDIPNSHYRGEANAVLTALEEFLDLGDAEAWCKSCRRVWEGRNHRCESTAEQQLDALRDEHAQLGTRVEHLMRTLHAVRRLNTLTADSCRVQAAEHARDNLEILRKTLPVPVHNAAGSARAEFLNLCAQWGLRTGHGSREIVARILQQHAHEIANDLRVWSRTNAADADEPGSTRNVREGANRIDPYSTHYAGAQHS
ncbi:hypothetical protein AB0958_19015 [Streptomyces sp. NPDC006655]|uniref:hypothetical protein n=1 Tax=Streptomyces sp. NPDC006655 TaxID=3156898 RepID=UPI003454DF96